MKVDGSGILGLGSQVSIGLDSCALRITQVEPDVFGLDRVVLVPHVDGRLAEFVDRLIVSVSSGARIVSHGKAMASPSTTDLPGQLVLGGALDVDRLSTIPIDKGKKAVLQPYGDKPKHFDITLDKDKVDSMSDAEGKPHRLTQCRRRRGGW
jgi:hypothetical protein